VPNVSGRVLGTDGEPVPGLYAAGWIKRGPSGVIGTNKKDAVETVEQLLADAAAGKLVRQGGGGSLEGLLQEKGADFVEYAGWQAIDAAERAAGESRGRPRVKVTAWDKLLETGRRLSSKP